MKAKKSIWAVMALFLYSMSFVSCGNSDEPNGGEGGKMLLIMPIYYVKEYGAVIMQQSHTIR